MWQRGASHRHWETESANRDAIRLTDYVWKSGEICGTSTSGLPRLMMAFTFIPTESGRKMGQERKLRAVCWVRFLMSAKSKSSFTLLCCIPNGRRRSLPFTSGFYLKKKKNKFSLVVIHLCPLSLSKRSNCLFLAFLRHLF